MGYNRWTKLKLKESLVWLKLVKEDTKVKRRIEEDMSSQADLEEDRSLTETKKGLAEYTGAIRKDAPVLGRATPMTS